MSARHVRAVLVAAMFVALAVELAQWAWHGPRPAQARDVMLVYVGAEDCAPCQSWQRSESDRFRFSPEFARIAYREVKSPTLRDVLKDECWPEELRRFRDHLGRGAGVPVWLVIVDGEVVGQSFGASQWREAVLPKLRSLLR